MTSGKNLFRHALACGLSSACAVLAGLACAGCLTANEEKSSRVVADGDYMPQRPEAIVGWPKPRFPANNPYTPEKAILGRRLFFEPALSRNHTVSCAWCHSPFAAFADNHRGPLSHGVGEQPTLRNTPTLANVVFGQRFMLDGRVSSLEEQALLPLFASNEMDMTGEEIVARLEADTLYARLFRQAYGKETITLDRVTKALATYERTLVSHHAPYDRWAAGEDEALSPAARRGAEIFLGEKGGCFRCHVPPLFTDGGFHSTGLDETPPDFGRAGVTGSVSDIGKFKTPTLRNIEYTAPYMHDGRFGTLEEVVRHYDSGGKPDPNASPLMQPLGLTDGEVADLVEFLHTLTDPVLLAAPRP